MSSSDIPPLEPVPVGRPSRAGRNLPVAITSGVVLGAVIIASLVFWKPAFLAVVLAAILVGIWELKEAFAVHEIRFGWPLVMAGAVAMIVGSYLGGPVVLLPALAITAFAVLIWRLRSGVAGYVRDATAGVFTATYVPFLAGFVALMLERPDGVRRVVAFILVTVASDVGGYAVGVLFGRHPMAPLISPKKSWEGFAGSVALCLVTGWASVVYLLHGQWWAGLLLGAVAVVFATSGDLIESLVKRDLGIKDMSSVVPGHGGLMDRLDSLLATVVPVWLVLVCLVPVVR
ncbi:MAG TPA: phosphatidate cytidylyltransferase [Nocardioidaceae bacterium]|jgi:phosphatidate cytidylyltransferase|nr:phosphatidate cytidylyltransferase [Nocardioidaceae bacterium]